MDFGDFTVEETDLSKFEKSNALTDFEKYGNYTEYVTADGQVVNVSKYVNWRTNTFKIIGVVGTVVFTIESGKTLCDAINKAMDGDIRQANKEICGWAGASIGAINTMVYVSSAITPVCTGLAANGIGVIPAIGLELLIVGAAGIIGGIIGGVGGELVRNIIRDFEKTSLKKHGNPFHFPSCTGKRRSKRISHSL